MNINAARLWQSLMDMAQVGATDLGGNSRLALTDEDVAGRALLIAWAKEIDLTIGYDAIGNLFLRREGSENLAPIVMGSHLDTQPKGGRFDGIYGVLAGFEVLRTLHEQNIPHRHPMEVAVWTNEEGSRFPPAMMGSATFMQKIALEDVLATQDKAGITVQQELIRTNQQGNLAFKRPFSAYYETHIEQGPILEANQRDIGVVTGGQGILWLNIKTVGKAAHAGTTPMHMRRDSMLATANMMSALETMILQQFPEALITFGELNVPHASRNTIPPYITWSIDIRHPDDNVLLDIEQIAIQIMQKEAQKRQAGVEVTRLWLSPAYHFDPQSIQNVRQSALELGLSHQNIISGAGHDAFLMSLHCPTAMIFIPCEGGLSHNEAENITPLQAEHGAAVLFNSILKADQQLYLAQVS
jgi:beta-ureidopropionase / N-carbamoyl-L-amino-acid hydrolase